MADGNPMPPDQNGHAATSISPGAGPPLFRQDEFPSFYRVHGFRIETGTEGLENGNVSSVSVFLDQQCEGRCHLEF